MPHVTLTNQQLAAIAARAFPGDPLRDARDAGAGRFELRLAGGERLALLAFNTVAEAQTAVAALRLLRGEFDLPVPQLRAADEQGETVGMPYALVGGIEGETLDTMRAQINENQLYAIGQQLGETMQRVHRLVVPQFGALAASTGAQDERSYVRARLEAALVVGSQIGMVNNSVAGMLRSWFERFQPVNKQAALIHGNLSPATLLVRQRENGWKLGGVIGWEHALGWSPVWEHARLFEATDSMRDFALRVGYGNAYDERTQRTYEQVRENAMVPYRALLLFERMNTLQAEGDLSGAERARNRLLTLVQPPNA